MTLDLNCVRDTLLTLEEWLVLDDDLDFHRLGLDDICRSSEMLKHSKSSIAYTLVLLDEADFIKCSISYEGTGVPAHGREQSAAPPLRAVHPDR